MVFSSFSNCSYFIRDFAVLFVSDNFRIGSSGAEALAHAPMPQNAILETLDLRWWFSWHRCQTAYFWFCNVERKTKPKNYVFFCCGWGSILSIFFAWFLWSFLSFAQKFPFKRFHQIFILKFLCVWLCDSILLWFILFSFKFFHCFFPSKRITIFFREFCFFWHTWHTCRSSGLPSWRCCLIGRDISTYISLSVILIDVVVGP